MNQETIIETLKTHYPKHVRKELVKSMLESERSEEPLTIEKQYKIINQIFSYVLQQSGWKMGENSEKWDETPLQVMTVTFPKLNTTKWYEEQNLTTKKNVEIQVNVDKK